MSDNEKSDRDLLCEIRADVRHLVTAQADHETRIREVEKKLWTFAVAAAICAIVIDWIKARL